MHGILRGFTFALLFAAAASAAQNGSPDPAFGKIPLERWVGEGNPVHMQWTGRVLPVELSSHQRLQAKVEILVDGKELVKRRGKSLLVMFVQFSDSDNRLYQTHEVVDLQLVKEDSGKTDISYIQGAFVTPGDYKVSLAIFDTSTGEHSATRLALHVNPLKNDPLPDSWRDLPPVEIIKPGESPNDLFLPNITGRLNLPLETHRPVRVELLVNASPVQVGEPSRAQDTHNRSLADLIPSLKVIAQTDVRNGALNISLLDLTTQNVIFRQEAVHNPDWAKLGPALKQTGPNVIDVHALEHRQQNAQFFLDHVRRLIDPGAPNAEPAGPYPVLIILSGPMAFSYGANLRPIEISSKLEARVFYIRYHSIPPRTLTDLYQDENRRGRRTQMPPLGRGPVTQQTGATEPVDALEGTLKPLQPHLFDVNNPEQFRKALSSIFEEVSRL